MVNRGLKVSMLLILACTGQGFAQTTVLKGLPWKVNKSHILSPWALKVNPEAPLPEYPRPQLVRGNWKNLNGLWEYAIVPKGSERPLRYEGNILVPFAVESALSGVARTVGKDSALWYHKRVSIPAPLRKQQVLLHFGAVDWQARIFINGKFAGQHEGGYDPFTLDITSTLKNGPLQEIEIRVWDPTDEGPQPRGKQVKSPHSIWYTPVTGIWQTVWLEGVNKTYIGATGQTPDIDAGILKVVTHILNAQPGDKVRISAFQGTVLVAQQELPAGDSVRLKIPTPHLWSPADPFLYGLHISLLRKGKITDAVESYFAMRSISLGADKNGVQRMQLNHRSLFEFGPLDQGWWPDGLYTAPTEEAMKFDIDQLKAMGFNMIRKHIKVEPARYYAYCDKTGILVWQDMPSGDLGNKWENRPGVLDKATDKQRTPESEGYYRKEWNAIMSALYNYPCIVVWTPFNEAWGQFKTVDIAAWTRHKDPSRLVNPASGGNFYAAGDIVDLHNYPNPAMPSPDLFGRDRAVVLGEFGGLGLPVADHSWKKSDNWGYQTFKNAGDLFSAYSAYTVRLKELIRLGLSAAVYTQTTDVENETNGLMTYDRKVIKMPVDQIYKVNTALYDSALVP